MEAPTLPTLKRYHLTEVLWRMLLEKQGGVCALCRKAFKTRPVIDHCHRTGRVRGLIHPTCNGKLGKVKDDAEWCELAAAYLRDPPADAHLTPEQGYVTLTPRPRKRRGRRA